MPLPFIVAAAAATGGGFFKWARGGGDDGGGAGADFELSEEEREANRVLLLQDPEALMDRSLALRSARDATKVFDAQCVDYNSDDDEHQLQYTNGQVLWVDLKAREFKLGDAPSDADGSEGEEGEGAEDDVAVDLLMRQAVQVETALYYARAKPKRESGSGAAGGGGGRGGGGGGGGGSEPTSPNAQAPAGKRLLLRLGGRLGGAVATSLLRAGLDDGSGSDEGGGEEMVAMRLESSTLQLLAADAPELTTLDLASAGLTAEGARLLAAPLATNTRVTALNLRRNRLGADGCSLLCGALRQQPSITHLDLSNNGIGAVGLASLAVSLPHCASLTALGLARNDLSGDSGVLLGTLLRRCPELAHLELGNNGLTSKMAAAVAAALREPASCELVSLRISDNPIGATGLAHLVTTLRPAAPAAAAAAAAAALPARGDHCCSLTALEARNCAAGPRAAKAVAAMLQQPGGNRTLTSLGLAHNLLGAAGAEALVSVLAAPDSHSLERLELQGDAQCEAYLRSNVPHLALVPPTPAKALTAALS